MNYKFSCNNRHQQYIDIEFSIDLKNEQSIDVKLPAWRPGRYELGNFAKNIQQWQAFDEAGNKLLFKKINKDTWHVEVKGAKKLTVKYNYYAIDLNAGSTYLDETQLYVNPVNCCLYIDERMNEACTVTLDIPSDYLVATGLKKQNENILFAKDFHTLADSPFIASATVQHNMFVMDGVEFHLWFQGECKPNWSKLINDFFIFINEQFVMMKEFPADDYHFLFQITPYHHYHGVEHVNSTVIALGPGYDLMNKNVYDELLGISSHELYHSWNIKTIRPVEMMPYDYSKENYSRLGYVAEGITTYYGDLLLYRGGVFSDEDFFKTFDQNLQKHFDNFGRFNLSVADSSWDTWLDGYVPGVPNRKTSIYTEGALCAFILDTTIRKNNNHEKSLDDVMRALYFDFAKKNKGYTENDYHNIAESIAKTDLSNYFKNYVYGTASYEEELKIALNYLGLEMITKPSSKFYEAYFGFKLSDDNSGKIKSVYPNSNADIAGMAIGDKVIAINGFEIQNNLNNWCIYFNNEDVELTLVSKNYHKKVTIQKSETSYYKTYSISKLKNTTIDQKEAFEKWSNRRF